MLPAAWSSLLDVSARYSTVVWLVRFGVLLIVYCFTAHSKSVWATAVHYYRLPLLALRSQECLVGRLMLENGTAAEIDVWVTSDVEPRRFAHGRNYCFIAFNLSIKAICVSVCLRVRVCAL